MTDHERYEQLLKTIHTVKDLDSVQSLLGWDQRVLMPTNAAAARGETLATVGKLAHEIFTSEATGELLDQLTSYESSLDPDSDAASIIRVTRQDYEKTQIYPSEFLAEGARAGILGYQAWIEARETQDFKAFLPALTRLVDLRRQQIAIYKNAHPDVADDYDVLLNDFEPLLTAVEVDGVFDRLKQATIPLVQHVVEHADSVDDSFLNGHFPVEKLEVLSRKIGRSLGTTEEGWRLDPTVHPFASSIALGDIRLTTKYLESNVFSSYFSTMHEFGHGLYESNVAPALGRTTVQRGASMAWHESQSRMWENLVGRGRSHWDWATPLVQGVFPGQFDSTTPDQFYRAVNKLGPSLIRVEADELTYNLHIILRYELERDIFANRVELSDLPEAWNAKINDYLGIPVPNDTLGVMQDVHWGEGLFGYFPTYTLGNVVSLQLWKRIQDEIPDLEGKISRGETAELSEWLRSEIHQHGRKFAPKALLQKVLGTDTFDAEPLISYLTKKVHSLYGD
ncbi:MAG: carboxypeptidase M32 [Thermomicrobiales bacterium]